MAAQKYSFGYTPVGVPCPTLDQFREELHAVCRRYGACFEHESGWSDDPGKIVLIPFHEAWDHDALFGHLSDAHGGIPWLEKAKEAYTMARQVHEQTERRERQKAADRAEKEKADAVLAQGIIVQGKRYHLVPDE